jgi:hypothetical protein
MRTSFNLDLETDEIRRASCRIGDSYSRTGLALSAALPSFT